MFPTETFNGRLLLCGQIAVFALTVWFVVDTIHELKYNNASTSINVEEHPDGVLVPSLYVCPSGPSGGWVEYLESISCYLVDELLFFGNSLPDLKELNCAAQRAPFPPLMRLHSDAEIECTNSTTTTCTTEVAEPCLKLFFNSGIRLSPGFPIVLRMKVFNSIFSSAPLNTLLFQWDYEDSELYSIDGSLRTVHGNNMKVMTLASKEVFSEEDGTEVKIQPFTAAQFELELKYFKDDQKGSSEWAFLTDVTSYSPVNTLLLMQQSVQLIETCNWNKYPECTEFYIALLTTMSSKTLTAAEHAVARRCETNPSDSCSYALEITRCALNVSFGRPVDNPSVCELSNPAKDELQTSLISLTLMMTKSSVEITETTEKWRIIDVIGIVTGWTLFLLEFLHMIVQEDVDDRVKTIKLFPSIVGLNIPMWIRRALGVLVPAEEREEQEKTLDDLFPPSPHDENPSPSENSGPGMRRTQSFGGRTFRRVKPL